MSNFAVKNLKLSYGERAVVENFSFDFTDGTAFALMGASGCGKTTILSALVGLLQPVSGDLADFATVKKSVLFQEDRLLPWCTALENVALCSDAREAKKWLCAVGLGDKLAEKPTKLSGGQQRRVAIARVIAYGGEVLILDEPFSGLDEEIKQEIATILKANFKKIIFTTHDEDEANMFKATVIKI